MELIIFEIISNVGSARSNYIEAIHEAKDGNYDKAMELIKEGEDFFTKGHDAHVDLVQKEAGGEKAELSLILVHAEDQLMSAEGFRIIAEELIDIYKKMEK